MDGGGEGLGSSVCCWCGCIALDGFVLNVKFMCGIGSCVGEGDGAGTV